MTTSVDMQVNAAAVQTDKNRRRLLVISDADAQKNRI